MPFGKSQSPDCNTVRRLQDREMPAMAARATVIIGTTVVMRMQINDAFRLQYGKARRDQQYQ